MNKSVGQRECVNRKLMMHVKIRIVHEHFFVAVCVRGACGRWLHCIVVAESRSSEKARVAQFRR